MDFTNLVRWVYAHRFTLKYLNAKLRPATSFSQAQEDLWILKTLRKVDFFVDVGAHDGISYSNSALFALNGAKGICFEPVKESYWKLSAFHRVNRRVICNNYGISDHDCLTPMRIAGGLSYVINTEDSQHSFHFGALQRVKKQKSVELCRLDDALLKLHAPLVIDLLSIDVEGHELNVLASVPFDKYFFRAIILETHLDDQVNKKRTWMHRDINLIENLLVKNGYFAAHETWANTIYLHESQRHQLITENLKCPGNNDSL
jgi:FkbM family methyltransferase